MVNPFYTHRRSVYGAVNNQRLKGSLHNEIWKTLEGEGSVYDFDIKTSIYSRINLYYWIKI